MPLLSLDDIEATTFQALSAHGADDWIAHSVADAVRKAEAVGNRICGLYYLESYCLQLTSGRVDGRVAPVVSRPKPGVGCEFDGMPRRSIEFGACSPEWGGAPSTMAPFFFYGTLGATPN